MFVRAYVRLFFESCITVIDIKYTEKRISDVTKISEEEASKNYTIRRQIEIVTVYTNNVCKKLR